MIDDLYIEEHRYEAKLVIFDMSEFDIILGMGCLLQHNLQIDYQQKEILVGQVSDWLVVEFKEIKVMN